MPDGYLRRDLLQSNTDALMSLIALLYLSGTVRPTPSFAISSVAVLGQRGNLDHVSEMINFSLVLPNHPIKYRISRGKSSSMDREYTRRHRYCLGLSLLNLGCHRLRLGCHWEYLIRNGQGVLMEKQ